MVRVSFRVTLSDNVVLHCEMSGFCSASAEFLLFVIPNAAVNMKTPNIWLKFSFWASHFFRTRYAFHTDLSYRIAGT
ncbi:hypothetical protein D3C71_1956620 [compost metagenome]